MKNNFFNSLKIRFKIIIPLLLVMCLLFAAIAIITVYSLNKTFDYNTKKLIETKVNEINHTIENVSNKALYIALISSETKIVKKAYSEYYRTKNLKQSSYIIKNQFKKINEIVLKDTGYEPRIHFYLPPAISFCRCWSNVKGDNISNFRDSVSKVARNHSSEKGIETGRGGFVIRGIAPIFSSAGKYYGSVEVFFNINYLVKEITINTNENFAIFMNTDLLKIATDFLEDTSTNIKKEKQIIGDYILVEKTDGFIIKNLLKFKLNSSITGNHVFEYDNYKYAIIPLANFSGEKEGIGILQIDISDNKKSLHNIIISEFVIFLFLMLLISFFLCKLCDHYILKKIIITDSALQKLSKGEPINKISIDSEDEISNMHNSLNKLNENITINTNFAIEIGKENLDIDYKAISKNDLLGNSLVKMQKKIIKYSAESKKALEKYKKLSNLTFEGILIHDNGIAIDINLSFAKMFGYKPEELLGKNIMKLLIPEKYHKIISENIIKSYALPYEVEGIKKDGTSIPVEMEARDIESDTGNKIIRVVAIRDISLRKKAEKEIQKLSTAVEQSSNTMVITDIEGNIEYVNPKFTEITGYTAAEAIGQNPRILNAKTQPKEYYTKLWETITAGET